MNESEQAQAAADRKLLNDTIDAVMQDERTDEVMKESEQAQAIKQIRDELKAEFIDYDDLKEFADCLLEIVDSQAQKIAELKDRIEAWEAGSKSQSQIMAEQAQEIKRLKAANDAAEKARINSSLNEYYRKSL